MRIVNLQQFLELPEGTFYCRSGSGEIGWDAFKDRLLQIKVSNNEHLPGDWNFIDLNRLDVESTDELLDLETRIFNEGLSHPIDLSTSSCYKETCEDEVFLVYELEDLQKLEERIKYAIVAIYFNDPQKARTWTPSGNRSSGPYQPFCELDSGKLD